MVERITTVYETNDMVEVMVEELDGNPFIHVKVKAEFTPSLARYLTSLWDLLRIDLYFQGYEYVFSHSANERFARLFKGNWVKAESDYSIIYSKLEM